MKLKDFKESYLDGLFVSIDLGGAAINIFINEYKKQSKIYTIGLNSMENSNLFKENSSIYTKIGAVLGIGTGVGLLFLTDELIWAISGVSDLVYNLIEHNKEKIPII